MPSKLKTWARTLGFFSIFSPGRVFALESPKNLTEFVNNFLNILDPIIIFVAGMGFFGMVIGILKYVGAGGDEEKLGKAKQLIVYGLIGMFIMFSFWGLAKIVANSYLALGV